VHCASHVRHDLVRRGVTEHAADADHRAEDGADRARHADAIGKRDRTPTRRRRSTRGRCITPSRPRSSGRSSPRALRSARHPALSAAHHGLSSSARDDRHAEVVTAGSGAVQPTACSMESWPRQPSSSSAGSRARSEHRMRDIAEALPSFWLVQAGHVSPGDSGWTTTGWLIVTGWTAALSALAVYACRRDTRRA
jgi:hypothetical protein